MASTPTTATTVKRQCCIYRISSTCIDCIGRIVVEAHLLPHIDETGIIFDAAVLTSGARLHPAGMAKWITSQFAWRAPSQSRAGAARYSLIPRSSCRCSSVLLRMAWGANGRSSEKLELVVLSELICGPMVVVGQVVVRVGIHRYLRGALS